MGKIIYRGRRQAVWGLLLMLFGLVLLLDRLDLFEIDRLWQYWPLLLVVFGLNGMIGAPQARDFTGGLWTAAIGAWLFISLQGYWGLSFGNSWPIIIIISGVTILLEPMLQRRRANKESEHEQS